MRSLSASLQTLIGPGSPEVPDAELIRRFVERRDEAAFAALVHRHATLVFGVCRRVLRHQQDAEDAFQAAFVVLARNASRVQRAEAVGNWLYGVAYNVARKARQMRLKRETNERAAAVNRTEPENDPALRELLDAELQALPNHYRSAIVLCDLQGLSRKEAAAELGLPAKTLGTRLDRGRAVLARRLSRRGVTFSVAAFTAIGTADAAAPSALVSTTVANATAGTPLPPLIEHLTRGATKTMFTKSLTTVGLVAGGLVLVAGLVHAPSLAAHYSSSKSSDGKAEPNRGTRASRPVDPFAGFHALLRALHDQFFVSADAKDEKPALSGKWEKKEGELTLEFAGKDELKISPHGKDDLILILCSYTVDKDGLAKCKVTGFEGKEEIQDKLKEKVPVGSEFTFKWMVNKDAATLEDVKGEKFELFKSHLEGDFTKKK